MRSVDWRIVIKLIPSGRPTNQAVIEFCVFFSYAVSRVDRGVGGDPATPRVPVRFGPQSGFIASVSVQVSLHGGW